MYEITFFFSVMECWEYQNKYDVADENGEQTFFLKEESSCLMRSCCANARELEVSMQGVGHQILSPISNFESTNSLTNIYYDFFFNCQTEKQLPV